MERKIKDNSIKGRVWAFVLYPESCCDYINMISKLEKLGVPIAISPLHRPELNIEQENEVKNHYHCLMYFEGQKKEKNLHELLDMGSTSYNRSYYNWRILCDIKKVSKKKDDEIFPFFLKVNSLPSYFRYLIHLDSPKKQQFPDYKLCHFVVDDEQKYNHLVLINGFNERDYLNNYTNNPDYALIKIVQENNIKSIDYLVNYLVMAKNEYLLNYCKKNLGWIRGFLLTSLFKVHENIKAPDKKC